MCNLTSHCSHHPGYHVSGMDWFGQFSVGIICYSFIVEWLHYICQSSSTLIRLLSGNMSLWQALVDVVVVALILGGHIPIDCNTTNWQEYIHDL